MKKKQKSAAIGFIFITLLIDITGWGIIIPVVPKLIQELIHADVSEAARYGGWLSTLYAVMQFLFAAVVYQFWSLVIELTFVKSNDTYEESSRQSSR